jgi:hypothetical protein
VELEEVRQPTRLLKALEAKEGEAQYFFAHSSLRVLVDLLRSLDFTHVLCIGAPRIHEYVQGNKVYKTQMRSFVLDYDWRFASFWSPRCYAQYNLVTHYFYSKLGRGCYDAFLRTASRCTDSCNNAAVILEERQKLDDRGSRLNDSKKAVLNPIQQQLTDGERSSTRQNKLAIVLDPPFGAMVDPIARSLAAIREDWDKATAISRVTTDSSGSEVAGKEATNDGDATSSVFWIFPYFLESRVTAACPDIKMSDYKVEYDNHPLYHRRQSGNATGSIYKSSATSSPIRLYTNVPLSCVVLPIEDGYKYCELCDRYVANENEHCCLCNACTSKDGRATVHCKRCERCVKATYKHCNKCRVCHLPSARCVRPPRCMACGEIGHKRRDCPLKNDAAEDEDNDISADELAIPDKRPRNR